MTESSDGLPDLGPVDFERLAAYLRRLTAGREQTPAEVLQREGRDER